MTGKEKPKLRKLSIVFQDMEDETGKIILGLTLTGDTERIGKIPIGDATPAESISSSVFADVVEELKAQKLVRA